MNGWHRQYEDKGLTIVGVSRESKSILEPFVSDRGMEYIVAVGGNSGYQYRAIPHAWLVSARGKVVWEGNPYSLKPAQIEAELKNVRLTPEFKLPESLKKAEAYLNAGVFYRGLSELERFIERSDDGENAEDVQAAKEAIAKANKFGKEKLEFVQELAEEGAYDDASEVLGMLEKSFKGLEIGDKADDKLREWSRDRTIKLELKALDVIKKSEELIRNKKYKRAGGYLQAILKSRQFAETKARERAQKVYSRIEKYL